MPSPTITFRHGEGTSAALADLQQLWALPSQSEACQHALACWAAALEDAAPAVEAAFTREEWNCLADMLNSPWLESWLRLPMPGSLAHSVQDGCRLDGTDQKWGINGDALVRRIADLSYCEAWVVLLAVAWFWQHPDCDATTDEWWRAEWRRGRAEKK